MKVRRALGGTPFVGAGVYPAFTKGALYMPHADLLPRKNNRDYAAYDLLSCFSP